MLALEDVIVILEIFGACGAAMIKALASLVETGANGKKFPAKFVEKGASSGVFGIDRGKRLPVNRVKKVIPPMDAIAVIIA